MGLGWDERMGYAYKNREGMQVGGSDGGEGMYPNSSECADEQTNTTVSSYLPHRLVRVLTRVRSPNRLELIVVELPIKRAEGEGETTSSERRRSGGGDKERNSSAMAFAADSFASTSSASAEGRRTAI